MDTVCTSHEATYCEDCAWRPAATLAPVDTGSAIVSHVHELAPIVGVMAEAWTPAEAYARLHPPITPILSSPTATEGAAP